MAQPKTPDQILSGSLARVGGSKLRESMAVGYWAEAAGPAAAAASEAVYINAGVLTVRTANAVWSQELGLHKTEILRKLNARLGGRIVKDLRFRAEGIQSKTEVENEVSVDELGAVELTRDDLAEMKQTVSEITDITDERLRQQLARNIEKTLRWRRYRLNLGWSECRSCGSVHKENADICPLCRLTPPKVDAWRRTDL